MSVHVLSVVCFALAAIFFIRGLVSRRARIRPEAKRQAANEQRRIEKGKRGEEMVFQELQRIGAASLAVADLTFRRSDGRRTSQVDFLLRGANCLWILEVKNYSGGIEIPAGGGHWTAHFPGGKSISYDGNPLLQLDNQIKAVQQRFQAPVCGSVIMVGDAKPLSGQWPQRVWRLEDLAELVEKHVGRPIRNGTTSRAEGERIWREVLDAKSVQTPELEDEHVQRVKALRPQALPATAAKPRCAGKWFFLAAASGAAGCLLQNSGPVLRSLGLS